MSFLQNIFKSKLNTLTFVVFPIVIIILVMIWIFLLNPTDNSTVEISLTQSSQQSSNINSTQSLNSITTINSNKGNETRASFEDLDKPKTKDTIASSPVIVLTSPVASTPELDIIEILELLDKVDQLGNSDDADLDNQILEN